MIKSFAQLLLHISKKSLILKLIYVRAYQHGHKRAIIQCMVRHWFPRRSRAVYWLTSHIHPVGYTTIFTLSV